jgi:hypothetical protein
LSAFKSSVSLTQNFATGALPRSNSGEVAGINSTVSWT